MIADLIARKTQHVTTPQQVLECYRDMPDIYAIFLYNDQTLELLHMLEKMLAINSLGTLLSHYGYWAGMKRDTNPSYDEKTLFLDLVRPLAGDLPVYAGLMGQRWDGKNAILDVFHVDNVHWAAFIGTDPATIAVQENEPTRVSPNLTRTVAKLLEDDPETRFTKSRLGAMTVLPGFNRGAAITQPGWVAWHMVRRPAPGQSRLTLGGHLHYI